MSRTLTSRAYPARRAAFLSPAIVIALGVVSLLAACTTEPSVEPVAAWALAGDDAASFGEQSMNFNGIYSLTADGVSLDGESGFGITGGPPAFTGAGDFTVAAWVALSRTPDHFACAVSQLADVTGPFCLGIGDGDWAFVVRTADAVDAATASRVTAGATDLALGEWHHVIGAHDASAGEIRLYVDGDLVGTSTSEAPFTSEGPLAVGTYRAPDALIEYWPGTIADVRLYDVALDENQVAELHSSTHPAGEPATVPTADPATYADDLLRGTWEYVVPPGELFDLIEGDFAAGVKDIRVLLSFDGPYFTQGFVLDGEIFRIDGVIEGDAGIFTIDHDTLQALGAGGTGRGTFAWHLEGDELTLIALEECDLLHAACVAERADLDPVMLAVMEHTFTKASDDPTT